MNPEETPPQAQPHPIASTKPTNRDHDVEGQSDGFDAAGAYGAIDGFDDPSMGWARWGVGVCGGGVLGLVLI